MLETEGQESKDYKIKVLKKIFVSQESGWGVFKAFFFSLKKNGTIVGEIFDANEGDTLVVQGDFINHQKFGQQFKVASYSFIRPQDEEGIIKYLCSDRFKGVGVKSAQKIVKHFGVDTLEILEESPDRLKEIKGLGKKVVNTILQVNSDNEIFKNLMVKLSPKGIGLRTINKIIKKFGNTAIDVLSVNPYSLISNEEIKGIGFKTADTIASAFGIASNSPDRIGSAFDFILKEDIQKSGNLYMVKENLYKRAESLLSLEREEIKNILSTKIVNGEIIEEEYNQEIICVYRDNYYIEKEIAIKFKELMDKGRDKEKIELNEYDLLMEDGRKLNNEQKEAVRLAFSENVSIITGGPGTGKTTIIKTLLSAAISRNLEVSLCAPTGRAAKRMEETSGYKAYTIHRLLKIDPVTYRFVYNSSNPLPCDLIIVDESSMIDCHIFYFLLKALKSECRLVMIGDMDQLAPVGPGNVLRDLIYSRVIPLVKLRENFRQQQGSLIIDNAYRINRGEVPVTKSWSEELDFVILSVNNGEEAALKVENILNHYISDYPFNSQKIQVLTPMYRGSGGIDALNVLVQEKFNASPYLIKKEKFSFKKGDKVMQLKNNYHKMVFNGDQGIVLDYDKEEKVLLIDFESNILEYSYDEFDELSLAYAMSIHKSQGSEFSMVILLLLNSHYIMLNREIFYTAVTRAKDKLILISSNDAVQRSVSNAMPSERKTLLKRRLLEIFNIF